MPVRQLTILFLFINLSTGLLFGRCGAGSGAQTRSPPPGAQAPEVHVRLQIPEAPGGRLQVELEAPFGSAAGRRLRMARGVAGAYRPFPFARFVRELAAFGAGGMALAAVEEEEGTWRLDGAGRLERLTYAVDIAAASEAMKRLNWEIKDRAPTLAHVF